MTPFFLKQIDFNQCLDYLGWKLKLQNGEIPVIMACNIEGVTICAWNRFEIQIKKKWIRDDIYLQGRVYSHEVLDLPVQSKNPPHREYGERRHYPVNFNCPLRRYHTAPNKQLCIGWIHEFDFDAESRHTLPDQILEEARCIIKGIINHEMEKKGKFMNRMREELMMKACHPKRVEEWIKAGFDPFP